MQKIEKVWFYKVNFKKPYKITTDNHLVLIWCKKGKGKYVYHKNTFSFSQLEYLMIPKCSEVDFISEKNNDFSLASITISWPNDDNVELNKLHQLKKRSSDPLMLLSDYAVQHINSSAVTDLTKRHLAQLVLSELKFSILNNKHMSSLIANLELYIDEHIERKISIEELSQRIKKSTAQLNRICNNQLKQSPAAWVMSRRIKKACELLTNSSMSIKKIASKVGFQEQFHFSKSFKKIVGLSPMKYRQVQF
jgi:AraC family transcriptional regulator, arabinose operon regulatory protein